MADLSRTKKWSVGTAEPCTAIKTNKARDTLVSINNNSVMINYSICGIIGCKLSIL